MPTTLMSMMTTRDVFGEQRVGCSVGLIHEKDGSKKHANPCCWSALLGYPFLDWLLPALSDVFLVGVCERRGGVCLCVLEQLVVGAFGRDLEANTQPSTQLVHL